MTRIRPAYRPAVEDGIAKLISDHEGERDDGSARSSTGGGTKVPLRAAVAAEWSGLICKAVEQVLRSRVHDFAENHQQRRPGTDHEDKQEAAWGRTGIQALNRFKEPPELGLRYNDNGRHG
jgi:hypothetical protein